jgi:hypothetical protein
MNNLLKEITMRKSIILFYAVILAACFAMSGCATNLAGKSEAYKAEHARVFWAELSGGGTDGSAQAWANYRAHEAAERKVGR